MDVFYEAMKKKYAHVLQFYKWKLTNKNEQNWKYNENDCSVLYYEIEI